ncbi:peptidoglycan DD-metalloendopeptidase family protein [Pontibacter vulgaris]|uniref:peptidoglycan DD-metalloendopeptidase family protein n=1 Tax=Pontibacter vulgaris TaxID=2905679 RepID=UPI001FA76930|nr:peptidoglycan DD-metalloendopeptidase family protein [Pontibacter vulgaris]
MNSSVNLSEVLRRHAHAFGHIIAADLNSEEVCLLDFSEANPILQQADLRNTANFDKAVQAMLQAQQASIGVGGYLEDRFIYRRSAHFNTSEQSRNLHLGVDIWMEAEAEIYAPLDGTVHSFQDNANFGDYGPTIILQHELDGITFYTLYGHLARRSLTELEVGKQFKKGDVIAYLGNYPENGDWPPHLHFQIISDMGGRTGDYPGVATTAEKELYRQLCPNPNLILQSRHLPA